MTRDRQNRRALLRVLGIIVLVIVVFAGFAAFLVNDVVVIPE